MMTERLEEISVGGSGLLEEGGAVQLKRRRRNDVKDSKRTRALRLLCPRVGYSPLNLYTKKFDGFFMSLGLLWLVKRRVCRLCY